MRSLILTSIISGIVSVGLYKAVYEPKSDPQTTTICTSTFKVDKTSQEKTATSKASSFEQSHVSYTENSSRASPSQSKSENGLISKAEHSQELEVLNMERKLERFENWLKNAIKDDPNFNVGDYMQKHFAEEATDNSWAPTQENTLATLLQENKNFSDSAIKNIRCYSSYCQISLSAATQEQADELLSKTSRALYEAKQPAHVIAAPNIANSSTTLYIARTESSFDFNK